MADRYEKRVRGGVRPRRLVLSRVPGNCLGHDTSSGVLARSLGVLGFQYRGDAARLAAGPLTDVPCLDRFIRALEKRRDAGLRMRVRARAPSLPAGEY